MPYRLTTSSNWEAIDLNYILLTVASMDTIKKWSKILMR